MLITKNKRKSILNFLLRRWQILTPLAAIEQVLTTYPNNAEEPIVKIIAAEPGKQIAIIKQYIIYILPEASFINYDYESPCPLNPNDFMELYSNEQSQCISKVQTIIKKLRIK